MSTNINGRMTCCVMSMQTAHSTQFTDIGWIYLKHGSGVDKLDGGGSFVTLSSPDHQHFTIVIETMVVNLFCALCCYKIMNSCHKFDI